MNTPFRVVPVCDLCGTEIPIVCQTCITSMAPEQPPVSERRWPTAYTLSLEETFQSELELYDDTMRIQILGEWVSTPLSGSIDETARALVSEVFKHVGATVRDWASLTSSAEDLISKDPTP